MKYFIIAGEPSGDLHASNLVKELYAQDADAHVVGMGGDLMQSAGCRLVQHYKNMAFMGWFNVLMNLDKVRENFRIAERILLEQKPDVLILVDYPSFNLKMAKFVKRHLPQTRVAYYISPKIWAWKEYRIKEIKAYVDEMYTIFPFETDFYAKYDYPVTFVGNPLMDSIAQRKNKGQSRQDFCAEHGLADKPIIALLAGSRKQEIAGCLPTMLLACVEWMEDYQVVVAGAPGQDASAYDAVLANYPKVRIVFDATYELLSQADAAIVNSGTATLETALIGTPEVVVYQLKAPRFMTWLNRWVLHIGPVSLVNIIAQHEVVKELILLDFTPEKVGQELKRLLHDAAYVQQMKQEFKAIQESLGGVGAAKNAARGIVENN